MHNLCSADVWLGRKRWLLQPSGYGLSTPEADAMVWAVTNPPWLCKDSCCILIQCETTGTKAPQKLSACVMNYGAALVRAETSLCTCWIHTGLPSLLCNISVLAHRPDWCMIFDTSWSKSNSIEQSSFMSDIETKWLGCYVFKFISLSQLYCKIKHLTPLLICWFWNLKLLHKGCLCVHLTDFCIMYLLQKDCIACSIVLLNI